MHHTEGGSADTIRGVAPRSGSRITIPLAVPTHSRILNTPCWRFPAPPPRIATDSGFREIGPIVSRGRVRGYTDALSVMCLSINKPDPSSFATGDHGPRPYSPCVGTPQLY